VDPVPDPLLLRNQIDYYQSEVSSIKIWTENMAGVQAVEARGCVSCEVRTSSRYTELKQLSPQQAVEARGCVSCEIRSSIYAEVKPSPNNRPWRSVGVSCEVRTSSTYRKVKISPNRPWRQVGVSYEVRTSSTYEKSKALPVTGRGSIYVCFL
jgi:hypothetical protein